MKIATTLAIAALLVTSFAKAAETASQVSAGRYFDCLIGWGNDLITTSATASEIADLAESKCAQFLVTAETERRAELIQSVPSAPAPVAAPLATTSSRDFMQYVKRSARGQLVDALTTTRAATKGK